MQCRGRESNPHVPFGTRDFKSLAYRQFRHPGTNPKNQARIGIEPMYKGFADPRLTTWLPRHERVLVCGMGGARRRLRLLAGRFKIDLPADAEDIDAVGVVPVLILNERLGGAAGR